MKTSKIKDIKTGEIKELGEVDSAKIELSGKKYLTNQSFSITVTFSRKVINKIANIFRCVFDLN